jgi:hypothetical protein
MIVSFRKSSARRKVTRLIRDGVGVRERSWHFQDLAEGNRDDLAAELLTWVRAAMGTMRRPYGVDHVALALACRDGEGKMLCTNALGVRRPEHYYAEDAQDRVLAFFADAVAAGSKGPGEILAALLSLGDIAFAMEPPAAAA